MVDHQSCKVTSGLNDYLLNTELKFTLRKDLIYNTLHWRSILLETNNILVLLSEFKNNLTLFLPVMTDIQMCGENQNKTRSNNYESQSFKFPYINFIINVFTSAFGL